MSDEYRSLRGHLSQAEAHAATALNAALRYGPPDVQGVRLHIAVAKQELDKALRELERVGAGERS